MADVYGANATLRFNTTPAESVPVNDWEGKDRVINDSYEAAAAAAGTDVIVGRLPKGARILSTSRVFHDALGAGTTLALATRSVADGSTEVTILAAAASTSQAIKEAAASNIDTFPLTTTEQVDVIVKIAGGAATGTIKSELHYIAD